ncbi:MAG: DUF6647 family protein [Cellvibrionaceae bacterium]
MEILLGILIEWLSLNANIEISTPPDVVVMSSADLNKKYGSPVHALYAHHEAKIYLSSHIDLATIQGASVLLHELVHHYQNVSGAMDGYNCARESERLAYETQRVYLESNQVELMPELDQFNIVMRSLCSYLD